MDELEKSAYRFMNLPRNDREKIERIMQCDIIQAIEDGFNGHDNIRRDEILKDVNWLLEQVNLVHSHAPEGRNYTNAQYVKLLQEIEQLKRTNKMLGNIATVDVKPVSKDHPYGKPSTFTLSNRTDR